MFGVACSLPQQLDLEIPVVQLGRGGLGTACLLEDNLGVSISPSCFTVSFCVLLNPSWVLF